MKFTVSFFAILKVFQFIDALLEAWFILVTLPFCEILAVPLVTVPPVGLAKDKVVLATIADTTRDIFPPFRILKLFL